MRGDYRTTQAQATISDDRVAADNLHFGYSVNFADANAGTGKTATISKFAMTGIDAVNYNIVGSPSTWTATGVITPKLLTTVGTAVNTKMYDGTTNVTVLAGDLVGLVGNETLQVASTNGVFDSANAGQRTATVSYALADGNNGGRASNYIVEPVTVAGTITPKTLNVVGTNVAAKTYDGTATADVTAGVLRGLVGNETLDISAVSGTFDSANAGQRIATVTYGLANGSNGGLASNYVLTPVALSANITPKRLVAVGGTVANKTYDGTAVATATPGSLLGLIGSEQLNVTVDSAFDGVNAGQHTAAVTYNLSNGNNGGLAANYTIEPTHITASITPRALSVVGASVSDKVYDGAKNAAATEGTLAGLVGNETLGITGFTGEFDSANAGRRLATLTYVLSDGSNGGLASNYMLTPVKVIGNIKPKTLTVSGTTVSNKDFDGSATAPTVVGTLSGLVGNETLGISANGRFDGSTPGMHDATVSYTLKDGMNGGQAGNYVVEDTSGLTAQIKPGTAIDSARTVAHQALALAQLPVESKQTILSTTLNPNVVALPSALSAAFGAENALTLLSAPRAGEQSEAVPLSAARDMLGGNVGGGRDVRVPVGRNTLAEIVNGGVRLPSGVDQLLFVVADGNNGNGTNNAQDGRQPAESRTGGLESSDRDSKKRN